MDSIAGATRITQLLRHLGLPGPELGESNEQAYAKVVDALEKLIGVVDAARNIPRAPSAVHRLLTPGWDELNRALAALGPHP